jgi:hypothetical protein
VASWLKIIHYINSDIGKTEFITKKNKKISENEKLSSSERYLISFFCLITRSEDRFQIKLHLQITKLVEDIVHKDAFFALFLGANPKTIINKSLHYFRYILTALQNYIKLFLLTFNSFDICTSCCINFVESCCPCQDDSPKPTRFGKYKLRMLCKKESVCFLFW